MVGVVLTECSCVSAFVGGVMEAEYGGGKSPSSNFFTAGTSTGVTVWSGTEMSLTVTGKFTVNVLNADLCLSIIRHTRTKH